MLEKHPYYPPVVNNNEAASFAAQVASEAFGKENVIRDVEPTMAGEDFSFIARKVPSAFAFLGIRNETAGSTFGLHTAQFMLDESVLKKGAALHVILATEFLQRGGFTSSSKASARTEL
jgi:IAA-amino acid hydrolase